MLVRKRSNYFLNISALKNNIMKILTKHRLSVTIVQTHKLFEKASIKLSIITGM